MRVLGIDPGPVESAYVLWDGKKILTKGKVANDMMLGLVRLGIQRGDEVFKDGKWHGEDWWIGIEMIASYGAPVGQETFETCVMIGRMIEASGAPNSVTRVTRKEIGKHLCNDGRTKDPIIRQRLLDLVGPQGTKANPGPTYGVSKDVWSALAVAITVYDQLQEGTYK